MSGGVFGDIRHITERLLILQDADTNFLCLEDCFTNKLLQMQRFTDDSHRVDSRSDKEFAVKSQVVKEGWNKFGRPGVRQSLVGAKHD